jgi:hypothetical protein
MPESWKVPSSCCRGHLALALEHFDLHVGLAILGGGEHLRLFGGNGGVAGDQLGHHAAQGFHAQGQGGHVQQQDVLHFTGQHTALDGGTHGHHLIGVDGLVGILARVRFTTPYRRDAGGTAHQHHFVDGALGELGILEGLLHGDAAAVDQIGASSSNLARVRVRSRCLGPSGWR